MAAQSAHEKAIQTNAILSAKLTPEALAIAQLQAKAPQSRESS